MDKIKLIVIAGPTASGKSDLAIRLARRFNGEIISADSRQVYRGMDIGTGKVPRDRSNKSEVRSKNSESGISPFAIPPSYFSGGIRHHLLDIASPKRQYSVAHFKRDAQKAIADIVRRGKLPIICGGTGFWIDALVYGQSIPDVKPDVKLRAKLRKLPPAQLFNRLQKLDPARAAVIDRHNPVRLIRALEIVLSTGKPVPMRTNGSPYELLYLGVSRPAGELKRRIEKRLDTRLKSGTRPNGHSSGRMVAEVRRLHHSGVSWKRLESFGLEYRWVARYLQGKTGRQEMRDALLRDINAYAKRQLTWWKKNSEVRRVSSVSESVRLARAFIKS